MRKVTSILKMILSGPRKSTDSFLSTDETDTERCNVGGSVCGCRRRWMYAIKEFETPLAGKEPLPTMDRRVSGKTTTRITKNDPA